MNICPDFPTEYEFPSRNIEIRNDKYKRIYFEIGKDKYMTDKALLCRKLNDDIIIKVRYSKKLKNTVSAFKKLGVYKSQRHIEATNWFYKHFTLDEHDEIIIYGKNARLLSFEEKCSNIIK